eukprot:7488186-Karenia_brevis.AAC.1
MRALWLAVRTHIPNDVQLPANITSLPSSDFAHTLAFRVQLQVLQKWMQNAYSLNMKQHRLHHRREQKRNLLNSPWHRDAYKSIRADFTPPIVALQDDSGNFLTKPADMDALLQHKWQHVYEGNMVDH